MISVAYFISGHGYGHAVRSGQVIRRLKDACLELEFHVRTTAPRWFLLHLPFSCDMEIFPNQKSIPLIARTSFFLMRSRTMKTSCARRM